MQEEEERSVDPNNASAAETQEIEVNFRLDAEGRTAPPATASATTAAGLDYRSQTVQASIGGLVDDEALLDELLLDCEIADSALLPRTFWVAADGKPPRCTLEQMALDVFDHHVPSDSVSYDPATSGAEWWVQIRPFPPGGRYAMLASGDDTADDNNDDDMTPAGVSFHWDKDEDLRQLTDGQTNIHPHLSTVTYLTDRGAPTLAMDCRIHPLTGEWLSPTTPPATPLLQPPLVSRNALVCWPRVGKHLSFDGRYLHAAPPDLLPAGVWEKQQSLPLDTTTTTTTVGVSNVRQKRQWMRRHQRVTFLVNIWLHYRPFHVQPFPATMLDKLSRRRRTTNDKSATLLFANRADEPAPEKEDSTWTRKTWPMGSRTTDAEEESIALTLPMARIHHARKSRGDVRLVWPVESVELRKSKPSKKARTAA
jgi:hypothetical protein